MTDRHQTIYRIETADGYETTTDAEVAEGLSRRWGFRVTAVMEGDDE